MDTKPAIDLRKAYKTTVFIGLAMMSSLFIYAIIVETIKKQHAPFGGYAPIPDVIDQLRYTLLAVAIVEFFLIRFLNKLLLTIKIPLIDSRWPASTAIASLKLMTAAIVTFALCESVAIYGLVLFLIQGKSTDFYLFLLISLFYFSIFFPKFSTWDAWVKEREKSLKP